MTNGFRNRSVNLIIILPLVATLSLYCLFLFINFVDFLGPIELDKNKSLLLDRRPRTNILFLKTHKTGSSTLQNILLRFGLRYSLDVMLPKQNNYIAYERPLDNETLDERYMSANGKFNIFACHSRYHRKTMEFMYEDTIRVTLVRDAAKNFESFYNFFHLDLQYKTTFEQLLSSLPKTSLDFTRKRVEQKSTNQICHDLGLWADSNPSDTIIENFVRHIDKEFHFVMITEYFDVCLVLLADLMNWPLEYVAYIPLMKRAKEKKSNVSLSDETNLRQLNQADASLYDYFLKKLYRRIVQYGISRLIADLRRLRKLNDELYVKCISGKNRQGWEYTIAYNVKPNADWECIHAAQGELSFIEEIRRKQLKRFAKQKRLLNLISM